jgi:PAS domain S-box-containing protein
MNDAAHHQWMKQYTAVLQDYLTGKGEAALLRAYELGRSAVAEKLNVLEMVAIHQEALMAILLGRLATEESTRITQRAADLLAESLAPFELAQRSSQEGKALLHHLNAGLERQVAERTEALQRAEEKYRGIFENSVEGIFQSTLDGRFITANPAMARIHGYESPEDLIVAITDIEHQLYVDPQRRAEFVRLLQEQGIVSEFESQVYRKDGSVIWIAENARAIRDARDKVMGYEGTVMDITEKVRLQEQLVERERLAAIGTTAATFAHEVGNPLNSMYMAAQLLERRLARKRDLVDDTLTTPLRNLMSEIRRLTVLLEEFRGLARRQKLNLRPTSLALLVADLLAVETPAYAARGIKVEPVFPPDLPAIIADDEKLKQVLLNLCKNAAEAMPHGGTLTLHAHNSGERVRLEVSDTGIGIPAGVDIFEPFTTTKPQGTGLGLTVVRQIVSAHRGTLTYHSVPGEGTIFTLMLPVSQDAEN